jgi:hypothetical protein
MVLVAIGLTRTIDITGILDDLMVLFRVVDALAGILKIAGMVQARFYAVRRLALRP